MPTSATCLQVRGELDIATAPALAALLADGTIEELDLSGISFIDAAGLRVLVAARGAATRAGLRLLTPSTAVTRILELADDAGASTVWP